MQIFYWAEHWANVLYKYTLTIIIAIVPEDEEVDESKSKDVHWSVDTKLAIDQPTAVFRSVELWRQKGPRSSTAHRS